MRFTEYKMRDLINKSVIWKVSSLNGNSPINHISIITAVNSKGFAIDHPEANGAMFSFYTGKQLDNPSNKRTSECTLLSPEEVEVLRNELLLTQKKNQLISTILNSESVLKELSVEQLQSIASQLSSEVVIAKAVNNISISINKFIQDNANLLTSMQTDISRVIAKLNEIKNQNI